MLKEKICFKRIGIIITAIIIIFVLQKIKVLMPLSIFGQIIEPILTELIIALSAGFYGPVFGLSVGLFGKFFGYFYFNTFILSGLIMYFYDYLKFGLYGLFIGIFWKKYNFSENIIKIKNIVLFCCIQIISNLLFIYIISFKIENMLSFLIKDWFIILVNKIIWTLPYIIFFIIYNKIKEKKDNRKENGIRPNCT